MISFNLAIERLVISGQKRRPAGRAGRSQVSISQSRCLSFQVYQIIYSRSARSVSISQSRCLSFQGNGGRGCRRLRLRFNLAIEMLIISGEAQIATMREHAIGFNLAIEMLIISGMHWAQGIAVGILLFQSRNRDAYHFRVDQKTKSPAAFASFNLAIEMLIISGTSPPRRG